MGNNLKITQSTGIFKLKKELEILNSVLLTLSHYRETEFLYIILPFDLEILSKLFKLLIFGNKHFEESK